MICYSCKRWCEIVPGRLSRSQTPDNSGASGRHRNRGIQRSHCRLKIHGRLNIKKSGKILVTLEEIAVYSGRSKNTILKWVEDDNFLTTKVDVRFESNTDLIDNWQKRRIEKMTSMGYNTWRRKDKSLSLLCIHYLRYNYRKILIHATDGVERQ